jgi:hypothetical protein
MLALLVETSVEILGGSDFAWITWLVPSGEWDLSDCELDVVFIGATVPSSPLGFRELLASGASDSSALVRLLALGSLFAVRSLSRATSSLRLRPNRVVSEACLLSREPSIGEFRPDVEADCWLLYKSGDNSDAACPASDLSRVRSLGRVPCEPIEILPEVFLTCEELSLTAFTLTSATTGSLVNDVVTLLRGAIGDFNTGVGGTDAFDDMLVGLEYVLDDLCVFGAPSAAVLLNTTATGD